MAQAPAPGGTCCCTGLMRLARSGAVGDERAARGVLLGLQVFAAVPAAAVAVSPGEWLPWSCWKLGLLGPHGPGICACTSQGDASLCYAHQLVYRIEGALITVLLSLLIATVGGCAVGASRLYTVGKFMAVLFLGTCFLLVSNNTFSALGTVATSAAAVFLACQTVLLIDFGYWWSESWYASAKFAKRRRDECSHKMWLGLILAASAVLGLGAFAYSVYLCTTVDDSAELVISVTAVLLCLVALFISITDWCEHGALLASCVVLAYTAWLISQMLEVRQPWLGLCICAVSLVATAQGTCSQEEALPDSGFLRVEDGKPLVAAAGAAANPGCVSAADQKDFATQCLIHAAAAIYITSELAPKGGSTTFAFHATAALASPLLHLWTLVAPKVFPGRDFS